MRNLPWFFLIMVAAITILNLRVWGLLTLITIGQDGVLYKSPITERLYPWSEIRTAGMYLKYGNRVHVLDRHLYNEKYFVKLKYVWFSRNPAGAPSVFTFPGEDYCDFEFNKNAWELFNRYLIGIDDPNNLQSSSKLRAQESERRGF